MLADRGFDIANDLGACVLCSYSRGQGQLSLKEERSKGISRVRTHIE